LATHKNTQQEGAEPDIPMWTLDIERPHLAIGALSAASMICDTSDHNERATAMQDCTEIEPIMSVQVAVS